MLAPKKIKHRKWQRTDKIRGQATRKIAISFGSYGLKALTSSWVTARQIEAARRVMTRYTQRGGKIWIRIFPDKPMTKGAVDHYVAVVKAGTVMFEMAGVTETAAQEAMTRAAYKLPLKCKFISRK